MFPEYYDKPDFKRIWETAIFIFDASSLVKVYWDPPGISSHFLSILERLSSERRLCMPYQFAYEYHRLLPGIRAQIEKYYGITEDRLSKLCDFDQVIAKLRGFSSDIGFSVETESIEAIEAKFPVSLNEALQNVLNDFLEFKKAHLDRLENDGLVEQVAELFNDACQKNPFSDSELEAIYINAQLRHDRGNIPPVSGKDMKNKNEPNCYSDLVAWEQIILYAGGGLGETVKPIVLVTDDKDWLSDGGARIEQLERCMLGSGYAFMRVELNVSDNLPTNI